MSDSDSGRRHDNCDILRSTKVQSNFDISRIVISFMISSDGNRREKVYLAVSERSAEIRSQVVRTSFVCMQYNYHAEPVSAMFAEADIHSLLLIIGLYLQGSLQDMYTHVCPEKSIRPAKDLNLTVVALVDRMEPARKTPR